MPTRAIDMSDRVADHDMPWCPLCDDEIEDWDRAAVIAAHGAMALAHADCVEKTLDEDIGKTLDVGDH